MLARARARCAAGRRALMGSPTASSSTPAGSTSRSARMVATYCAMMSAVAAPAAAPAHAQLTCARPARERRRAPARPGVPQPGPGAGARGHAGTWPRRHLFSCWCGDARHVRPRPAAALRRCNALPRRRSHISAPQPRHSHVAACGCAPTKSQLSDTPAGGAAPACSRRVWMAARKRAVRAPCRRARVRQAARSRSAGRDSG
jgi:hypothetical protein